MAKGSSSLGNTAKRQPKKRKSSVSKDDDETEMTARPHSAALHSLQNEKVQQLRATMLEWFAEVRDLRGMPWRRPAMDVSPEEQAQRAYEVRESSMKSSAN